MYQDKVREVLEAITSAVKGLDKLDATLGPDFAVAVALCELIIADVSASTTTKQTARKVLDKYEEGIKKCRAHLDTAKTAAAAKVAV